MDGSLEDGENAGDSDTDSKKVWEKEEWSFFTPAKLETGKSEQKDSIGSDTSKVLFIGKGFGQTFDLRFSKTNGKWFLVWYGVENL